MGDPPCRLRLGRERRGKEGEGHKERNGMDLHRLAGLYAGSRAWVKRAAV
jgi:hypothetical protein